MKRFIFLWGSFFLTMTLSAQVQVETVTGFLVGETLEIQQQNLNFFPVSGQRQELPLRKIISFSWSRLEEPKRSGLIEFVFRNSDRLYGDIVYEATKEQSDVFKVAIPSIEKPINLYLTDLAAISFGYDRVFPSAVDQVDQLFFKNGDSSKGSISSITNTGFQFTSSLGTTLVPFSDIELVVLAKKATKAPSTELVGMLNFNDGSQLTATLDSLENSKIQVTTFWAIPTKLVFSVEYLRTVYLKNGEFQYLSDLEPIDILYVPFFTKTFPYKRDQNQRGGTLMLRGKSYAKGLGVHSKTTLIYELGSKYQEFRAIIGLDDSIKNTARFYGGKVLFQVVVDGTVKASHLLQSSSEPISLSISVADVEELELVVDFGATSAEQLFQEDHINDLANWCNAILIE